MYEGELVRLRSLEISDLDSIMENWNNLELRRNLSVTIPYSRDEEREWIKRSWSRKNQGEYQFAVEHKETKEFLGTAGLFDKDNFARSAELGIAIHAKKNWSKGYGTDTMKVLLKIGFNYLNLNRIQLRVFAFNERGYKTYIKVGFKEVGRLRQAQFVEGNYVDVIYMDILRDEWREKYQSENKV